MKISQTSFFYSLLKRITPFLGRCVASLGCVGFMELIVAYLNILIGKGAGTGWDEAEVLAPASVIKSKNPVIIDGGANVGRWTLALRKIIGGSGQWILVEPEPICVEKLRSISSIEIIAKAIGEQDGDAILHTPEEGSGFASLSTRRDSFFPKGEILSKPVSVVTIDTIVKERNIETVDFLKLDIEGHELFALKGAKNALSTKVIKALSFEFGSGNIYSRTFFRDYWDFLTPLGYRIMRISPGGRLIRIKEYYEDLEFFRGVSNYIAVINT